MDACLTPWDAPENYFPEIPGSAISTGRSNSMAQTSAAGNPGLLIINSYFK
jgi:hypothetical protein